MNRNLELKLRFITETKVPGVDHCKSNKTHCCDSRLLFIFFPLCRLHLKNLKPASVELTVVLRRTFQLMYDGYYVDAFAAAAL